MKKLILGLTLVTSILSSSLLKADCTPEYFDRTVGGNKLENYIEKNWNGLQWFAYINGAVIISNPILGAVVYTLPLTLWAGAEIADSIHDEKLKEMIRIINYADFKTGVKTPPVLRHDYVTVIDVDADNRNERRRQRAERKDAKYHNRLITRYNRDLSQDMIKSAVDFNNFHSKLVQAGLELNSDELAQKISDLNANLSLCNGDVGTTGIDQDELVLRPYLAINGKTKKERRAQKRENNRIEARNKKASRKLNKNILATQEDIINYLK
jgi:hypothetical protein